MPKVTSERLAVGLLFVVIAALACFAPTQTDTWWHLRGGQDLWRTASVPLHDSYSYTAAGRYWPNHEWLTEGVLFALFSIGGLPLVTLGCAALIVAAWTMSWRLMEGPFELRFLLFAASLAAAAGGWAVRPQVFSLAAFALTCTLLVANRIRWLPLLFVAWTNLHGAVMLGLVAVGAALVASTVAQRRVPKALALTTAACALATAVSPLGFRLWPEIVASIERSRVNHLMEWQAPGFPPALWPFWAIVLALPIATIVRWRHIDPRTMTLAAIALGILPLAVTSMRNVAVFLLIAVPALAALLSPRARAASRASLAGEHVRINAAILGVAAAAAAAIVALGWMAPAPSLNWRPMSAEAARAVAACPPPLYNTYGDGGVLIWFVPQQKVFIDNRQDPYPMDLLRANNQLERDGDYSAVFSRYGIRCAVVPPDSPITRRLEKDVSWSANYSDGRWTIFTRTSAGVLTR